MKAAFSTLGCRVNQYETEAMTEKFIKAGYDIVPFDDFADVYVINTCTVTSMGDKKSRQMVRRARRLNGNAIIAVVGCYSQVAPLKVSQIDGVDIVLGTRNKGKIMYWINKFREENRKIIAVHSVMRNDTFEDLNIEEYQDKTRAFLKIQDGCNRFCSYCLIPYARGRICSKNPEKVIEEVKKLALHGYKEIILSGIHIASYGTDLDGGWDLVRMLEAVNSIDGIERIRIGSIDPAFFSDDVIKKVSQIKKLCPHFHLSLQSGCDETLKRMNRHYTTNEYKDIVSKLRSSISDVSVTTDVIVGFPGESDEEFNITYDYLKDIKLTKMHIFKYSPRKGTKAFEMKDKVSEDIKEYRSHKLLQLSLKNEKEFMDRFIGRSFDVLYEHECRDGYYEGYTSNYIKVVSKGNECLNDKILLTKITGTEKDFAYGEIINS